LFVTPTNRKTTWIVLGAMALTVLAIVVAFARRQAQARAVQTLLFPAPFPLLDFTLTNQLGQAVSLRDLRGKVWVGDIIFTRCGGPCPKLAEQTGELQTALLGDKAVRLVTLTTDPEYDTPEVLKRYSERFKADPAHWWFLSGTKKEIAALAIDGLKLTAMEKEPASRENPADLFIHSLLMVVVDKHGRLRAAFESTESGWKDKVLATTRYLAGEQ
jgi:cytochrome oxidase Cu insertion factor (SCO1/SenC/PrrC family)